MDYMKMANLNRQLTTCKLEFDPLQCDFKVRFQELTSPHKMKSDVFTYALDSELGWLSEMSGAGHDLRPAPIMYPNEPLSYKNAAWTIQYPLIQGFGIPEAYWLHTGVLMYLLMHRKSCAQGLWTGLIPANDFYKWGSEDAYYNAIMLTPLQTALNEVLKNAELPPSERKEVKIPLVVTNNLEWAPGVKTVAKTAFLVEAYYMASKMPKERASALQHSEFPYHELKRVEVLAKTLSDSPSVRCQQILNAIMVSKFEVGEDRESDLVNAMQAWVLNNMRVKQASLIYKMFRRLCPESEVPAGPVFTGITLPSDIPVESEDDDGGDGVTVPLERDSEPGGFAEHRDGTFGPDSTLGKSVDITFIDDGASRRYGDYDIQVNPTKRSAHSVDYSKYVRAYSAILAHLGRRLRDIRTYNTGGKMPGQERGKLDRKNLYKYRTSGKIFYNNTYKQKEQDLAIGVLLDESGSMASRDGIENGRAACILLHEVLTNLNINHCIAGHTSSGRQHDVEINPYVWFRENKKYVPEKCTALAEIYAKCGNCDSGALYFMEQELLHTKNKDRLCLIFSDGAPTECTETELKEQVAHMEKKHIKVIGIGVGFPSIARYYNDCANGNSLTDMLNIVCDILQRYILQKDSKGGT